MQNRWNNVYSILITSFVVFTVLLGTPILGSFSANFFFEDMLGCHVSSGLFDNHSVPHHCFFYGLDFARRVEAYSLPISSFFLTPISFLFAFFDILIVWLLMIFYADKKRKNDISEDSSIDTILYWIFITIPFILMILLIMSPLVNKYQNHELSQQYVNSMNKQINPAVKKSTSQNKANGIRF